MVWEQQALVVVMTTRVMERGRTKCAQYWQDEEGSVVTHGYFKCTTQAIEQHPDYVITSILLTNTKVNIIFYTAFINICHNFLSSS